MKRVILVILDSVGIGELPDAWKYGDAGSNTLGNTAKSFEGFSLENLRELGLGNIEGVTGISPHPDPGGCYGKMAEKSPGKDTITGHWEIAGIILDKPFPTYPDGFPGDLMDKFEKAIGTRVLGNMAASGTEIIKDLGDEHVRTGYPIVYTSADSVFQIAAHEEVIPLDRLYEICRIAREMLKGEHGVARVIARPFMGEKGNYVRTSGRKDFSMEPTGKTVLEYLVEKGHEVMAVGKIKDIFAGRGISRWVASEGNMDGLDKTVKFMQEDFSGLLFTNLVDFDMLYGHRNDPSGYARALMEFDRRLPELLGSLRDEDILIITADHGCDPLTPSTDHSREYVPLLVYGGRVKKGVNLGIRDGFTDIAATLAELFGIDESFGGRSFLREAAE